MAKESAVLGEPLGRRGSIPESAMLHKYHCRNGKYPLLKRWTVCYPACGWAGVVPATFM